MSKGRPPNIMRPVRLTTVLPEDIRVKLDLYLFSAVEGRIPLGAYSQFISDRIKEFFEPAKPLTCPICNRPISEHTCP